MFTSITALLRKNSQLFCLSIIVVIISLFCIPLLERPSSISLDSDWNQMYSYFNFSRNSVLKNFQFPLRCPYFGGGYPLIANPQDISLSPLFVIILIMGEVLGSKIICVMAYFLCAFGMYYLAKEGMNFTRLGALFSSLSLSLCSWLPFQLSDGNFTKVYYCALPFLTFFILKSTKQWKFIIYSAFLLCFIFLQGGLSFAAICLFLFLFFFFPQFSPEFYSEKYNLRTLLIRNTFIIIILSLLFGAVKFFPMLELLLKNSRAVDYSQISQHCLNTKSFLESLFNKNYRNHSTIYIGYGTLLLALIAFMLDFKNQKKLLFPLAVIALILLGPNTPINISAFLHKLPIFNSMDRIDKYFSFFVAFMLVLSAGASFGLLQKKMKHKIVAVFLTLFVIINTFDLFTNNINYHKNIFLFAPQPLRIKNEYFSQAFNKENSEDRFANAYLQYALLKKNIGLINWYGNIYLGEFAIPKYFVSSEEKNDPSSIVFSYNNKYRGELFFLGKNDNSAKFIAFSPNGIEIKANITTPDTLVINQNFDCSWRANTKDLSSWNGLLAIKINSPGEYMYRLDYKPVSFFVGLFITFFAIGLACIAIRYS